MASHTSSKAWGAIRTWPSWRRQAAIRFEPGAPTTWPRVLDEAHQHKLTVCVGFWLGHERHGFNYQDEASVINQLTACTDAVREFKDHPAVLLWGIGNEMEGEGTNPAIWYAVEHIARECKRIDPGHPTMTVIAELGKQQSAKHRAVLPPVSTSSA